MVKKGSDDEGEVVTKGGGDGREVVKKGSDDEGEVVTKGSGDEGKW